MIKVTVHPEITIMSFQIFCRTQGEMFICGWTLSLTPDRSVFLRWWVFEVQGVVEVLGWGLTRQSHADSSVSNTLNTARSTRKKQQEWCHVCTAYTARRRRDVGWDQIHTLLLTRLNQSPPTPRSQTAAKQQHPECRGRQKSTSIHI